MVQVWTHEALPNVSSSRMFFFLPSEPVAVYPPKIGEVYEEEPWETLSNTFDRSQKLCSTLFSSSSKFCGQLQVEL